LKASANIIAGIIFIVILITLIFPLFQSYLSSSTKFASSLNQMVGNAVSRVNKALSLTLYPDGTLVIINGGSSTEKISYLIINSSGSLIFVPMNSSGLSYLSQFSPSGSAQIGDPYTSMQPGSSISFKFPYNYVPVAVTTVDGAIAYVHISEASSIISYNQYGTSYLLNPVTFFASDLQSLFNSSKVKLMDPNLILNPTTNVISQLSGGVYRLNSVSKNDVSSNFTSIAYPLVLFQEIDNATISIRMNFTGNLINGFNPEWENDPNRNLSNPIFNMLISGISASNFDSGNVYFNVTSGNCYFTLTYYSNSKSNNWQVSSNSNCYGNFPTQLASWLSGSSTPWRIKMEGLNASKIAIKYYTYDSYTNTFSYVWHNGTQSIGKYYYGGISAFKLSNNVDVNNPQTSLVINGVVNSLKFYNINMSMQGKPSTYEPYMIIADTDGNSYPELIFTTEDFSFSYKQTGGGTSLGYTIADTYPMPNNPKYYAVDFTTEPIEMVLSQVSINGSQYMAVDVLADLYFHDSVYDVDELSTLTDIDRGLFSVMIVDLNNSYSVVTSKNFTYQDLASFESTWPPNTASFSIHVTLPIPYTNHLYEVAVGFWDPYSFDITGNQNNDEVTLGIELIGFQLYTRS